MTDKEITRISRRLSLILRHKPESIGLELDRAGWAKVSDLLRQLAAHGTRLSREELEQVVSDNDKQRFRLSDDGRKIRASQGHSIPIDLGLQPVPPPAQLYHGTATRFLDSILKDGLVPGRRQQVHLSDNEETATTVGRRHGKPVILTVDAAKMEAEGIQFYRSDNGVWLVDAVPVSYLSVSSYPK